MHTRRAAALSKPIAALCLAASASCVSLPHSFGAKDRCAGAAAIPQAFDSAAAGRLAGTYRLTIVSDWEDERGRTVTGRLVLQPTDSLHALYERLFTGRWRRADHRPLWGWADLNRRNVTVPWGADPSSRDPEQPGVLFHANGVLELGVWRGLDGSNVDLVVRTASASGLSGTWTSDLGIATMVRDGQRLPNPFGHFCAFRQ